MSEMNRLMEIRKARGLSRREVSQRSGINFRSLQDYEQGHKCIASAKGETLYRLSLVLGCTIEDLLDGELLETGEPAAETKQRKRMDAYRERLQALKVEIEQEEIYSKKYRMYGRWKVRGAECLLVFLHKGELVELPFQEEFTSGRFRRLAGRAAKQMEAYLSRAAEQEG